MVFAPPLAGSATLGAPPFAIHSVPGAEPLAARTLRILQESLGDFGETLPAGEAPIAVHLCSSLEAFQELSGPLGQRRIQGFARSREGIIVMKAPELLSPGANYSAVLRHELLHVLLARNTGPGFLPRWLNEGIAMELSREFRWSSTLRVARMYAYDRILPYDSLSYAFETPGNEEVFGDAYAQSLSMTKFLRERVGENMFWALVEDLKKVPFDEALRHRTLLTPEALYEEWRAELWQTGFVYYSVSGAMALPFAALLLVAAYLLKRRRAQGILHEWDKEERIGGEVDLLFPSDLEGREEPGPWEDEEYDYWDDDER